MSLLAVAPDVQVVRLVVYGRCCLDVPAPAQSAMTKDRAVYPQADRQRCLAAPVTQRTKNYWEARWPRRVALHGTSVGRNGELRTTRTRATATQQLLQRHRALSTIKPRRRSGRTRYRTTRESNDFPAAGHETRAPCLGRTGASVTNQRQPREEMSSPFLRAAPLAARARQPERRLDAARRRLASIAWRRRRVVPLGEQPQPMLHPPLHLWRIMGEHERSWASMGAHGSSREIQARSREIMGAHGREITGAAPWVHRPRSSCCARARRRPYLSRARRAVRRRHCRSGRAHARAARSVGRPCAVRRS